MPYSQLIPAAGMPFLSTILILRQLLEKGPFLAVVGRNSKEILTTGRPLD
jgi:hypothetical protein